MQDLIKIGDEIKNCLDEKVRITEVIPGRHGLLLKGRFDSNTPFQTYVPWELGTDIMNEPWYGWHHRCLVKTASNIILGSLSNASGEPHDTIQEYDLEWERTIETIRLEEMMKEE